MRFVTTKSLLAAESFGFALFEGIAPDGGLYVPESIPQWRPEELAKLPSMALADVGARVLHPFIDELDYDTLLAIVQDALAFPIPLVEVEPGIHALELFHGPTLAFKDVGARMMARLMAALFRGDHPLTILVATSGDTGSAVGHAFHNVPHTRVAILYPKGRISPTQEAQLTMFNSEATNVRAYAAAGNFDDCQRLTKTAFADPVLSRRANLTSANSINIGRLLPQMIYYVHAIGQLAAKGTPMAGAPVFSTPSGNFGNLTAGLMAKRSGVNIGRFIAATNANDVVPEYLATGRYEPRPSIHTVANAMDVGNPNNMERLVDLHPEITELRQSAQSFSVSDEEIADTIARDYSVSGRTWCPHTATAIHARRRLSSRHWIIVATAHPAKFESVVEPLIGRSLNMPPSLAQLFEAPSRFEEIDPEFDALKEALS